MDSSFPENEVLLVITIGVIIMLIFAMAFVLFFYFSQKKFQAERLQAQAREVDHQRQLLFGSIQAQEEERERIARELHDEVGSKLNVINLGLHHLQKTPDEEAIGELFEVVNNTIDSTRRISHDLLPPTLENFGLPTALEELCDRYNKNSSVKVRLDIQENDPSMLPPKIALAFFRITQELLSNSFKHSEATQISLHLWKDPQQLRLDYQDNGKGFPLDNPQQQSGLGLRNIESRVQMIEAQQQLDSAPGQGLSFQLTKPLT
ncbi:MAG: ATP-binding protein [Bacteroidota bacterium]